MLDRFITVLLTQDPPLWRGWATHVAAEVADGGSDLPVRFPLFQRVLLPVLIEGVRQRQPGRARWLAGFENLLCHSLPTGLPPELESRVGLLREAVDLDPNDGRALDQLIVSEALSFEYSLHELPVGVLFGQNGATPEQCDALLGQLGEFESHLYRSGKVDRYQELVNTCRFHYQAYRQYLTTRDEGMSYEHFLRIQGLRKSNTAGT